MALDPKYHNSGISFWQALLIKPTVKRAAKVSLLVGTLLIAINQIDLMLAGSFPPLWKIVLTFMVPYSVSSYSSAAFLSDLCRKNPNVSIRELIS